METLFTVIQEIKETALAHPNVRTALCGNIYDIMNGSPSIKYDAIVLSQTNHSSDDDYFHFGFNIFYVSRLEDDLEDNRLQIQSHSISILDNIFKTLIENTDWTISMVNYTPFTQKFVDECAGCYATVTIDIPREQCYEEY